MFGCFKENQNYKRGRIEIEGRIFQLEFWEGADLGLPYVRVSEIITKEVKVHPFTHKIKTKEIKDVISYGWVDEDRLKWGINRIAKYLEKEKGRVEELEAIEAFCNKYKVGD